MLPESVIWMLGSCGLVLFGIAVLVATRLVSKTEGLAHGSVFHTVLLVIGCVLIVVGMLADFYLLFSPIGVLLAILALALLAEAFMNRNAAQQRGLLWVMATAAERLIPLAPAIQAFAREHHGPFARRTRELVAMLNAGVTLPDALRRLPGLLPPRALPVILMGHESGALATALRRAASQPQARGRFWSSLSGRLLYVCALAVFGVCMAAGAIVYILPKYREIGAAFQTRLPPLTKALIAASQLVVVFWPLSVLLFCALVALLLYTALRYMGFVSWDLPGVGRLVRRLDTATILEALGVAAEYRRPLPQALALLARCYPKAAIRRRLQAVCRDLETGADWCGSLLARGLIRPADSAILRAAQRVGNLPWALAEMADSNRRRLAYRLHAVAQLLFPPLIITMGLAVMFFVLALFIPLVSLIQNCVT